MRKGFPGNRKTASDRIGPRFSRRARALTAFCLIALLTAFFGVHSGRADTLFVSFVNSSGVVEEFTTAGLSGVNTDAGPLTSNNGDANSPTGIAINGNGDVFVASSLSGPGGYISEFSPTGQYMGVFASGLNDPAGLAFDQFGNLFVANSGAGQVIEYPATGGSPITLPYNFGSPSGLAFDAGGNLYVADNGTGNIYEVSTGGSFSTFATPDGAYDNLNQPRAIAFDSAGNLFVANSDLNDIEELSPTGVSLGVVANAGDNIDNPYGIGFDSDGDLYVSNLSHNPPAIGTGTSTIEELSMSAPVAGQLATSQLIDTFAVNNLRDGSFMAFENSVGQPLLATVPEPRTFGLIALGAASLAAFSRSRRRRLHT